MAGDSVQVTDNVYVSLVCVCDSDPDAELRGMAVALQEHFPLSEIVATVREPLRRTPTLPNLHVLELAPPADDRVRLTAALDRSLGDVVVVADPARDDPRAVVQAARQIVAGAPAVYESWDPQSHVRRWMRQTSSVALQRATGAVVPYLDGVRACNREVLSVWLSHPDRDRLLQGFPGITGYAYDTFPAVAARPRAAHHARWRLAAIMAASATPLRWASAVGLAGAVLNLLYSLYVVVINVVRGETVEGWTSLSLQLAGMFLLFSIILALLAEYLFQLIKRGRERALYRVRDEVTSPSVEMRERLNLEDAAGNRLG